MVLFSWIVLKKNPSCFSPKANFLYFCCSWLHIINFILNEIMDLHICVWLLWFLVRHGLVRLCFTLVILGWTWTSNSSIFVYEFWNYGLDMDLYVCVWLLWYLVGHRLLFLCMSFGIMIPTWTHMFVFD